MADEPRDSIENPFGDNSTVHGSSLSQHGDELIFSGSELQGPRAIQSLVTSVSSSVFSLDSISSAGPPGMY